MSKQVRLINGYSFFVGKSVQGEGLMTGDQEPAPRDKEIQRNAGGSMRGPTHQGGHLVQAQHGGPAIPENHFAQEKDLNQGSVYRLERQEHHMLLRGDVEGIYTQRTAYIGNRISDTGKLPDSFIYNDSVISKNGTVIDKASFSYQNESNSIQSSWNDDLEMIDPNPEFTNPDDHLREMMSPSEYSDMMEKCQDIDFNELQGNWTYKCLNDGQEKVSEEKDLDDPDISI